jgi:hypothetical protein
MDHAPFSSVSALEPAGAGEFDAEVSSGWTIGGKPNGGYLLAMLGRAAVATQPQPHIMAASAHYLRPPEPGPVRLAVDVLRSGRSASQVRARMSQDGSACVEALITTATVPDADSKPYWSGGLPVAETPPFADCARLPGQAPNGLRVALLDEVDLRLDPACLAFAAGRPSGAGVLRGWLALPGDEPFDPVSLLFAVDAFPPATFDIEMSGWVPTFELTAYVRALPVDGPVRVLQQARLIDGDRVDEACFVWDSSGRLVAQATQLAGIRLG